MTATEAAHTAAAPAAGPLQGTTRQIGQGGSTGEASAEVVPWRPLQLLKPAAALAAREDNSAAADAAARNAAADAAARAPTTGLGLLTDSSSAGSAAAEAAAAAADAAAEGAFASLDRDLGCHDHHGRLMPLLAAAGDSALAHPHHDHPVQMMLSTPSSISGSKVVPPPALLSIGASTNGDVHGEHGSRITVASQNLHQVVSAADCADLPTDLRGRTGVGVGGGETGSSNVMVSAAAARPSSASAAAASTINLDDDENDTYEGQAAAMMMAAPSSAPATAAAAAAASAAPTGSVLVTPPTTPIASRAAAVLSRPAAGVRKASTGSGGVTSPLSPEGGRPRKLMRKTVAAETTSAVGADDDTAGAAAAQAALEDDLADAGDRGPVPVPGADTARSGSAPAQPSINGRGQKGSQRLRHQVIADWEDMT